ncbi:uncharacterized protein LOC103961652 isoform X1 [Pyrus x bretschneideri]|uniref:uncharacterized protein LOC103961652 isoform X1 n=1 Tax=Pyrus x bretschneideri TaxID=225117 RepID=UPI002030E837|nr:uncharacterized protein LOC103961652 isoform X1 [Pyrus x bretschneideri]XP_048423072.1 uncharacterized protein LOC103961652 isoform X1 [Pyrus x bretschneideri]XP_048423079.1 uncharacterized protein LOC103961652 isoform X1 [Pyrus x bretschneideri]
MDLSSWFRRKLLKNSEKTSNPDPSEQTLLPQQNEREEEQLGVTERLVDLVKSFTLDTFRNFPLPDDEGAEEDEDLSGWQERHATIVLSRVRELSHLRYKLCPRYLKERQFWRVYFMLVKKHVAEYELRAIQQARIKEMAVENEKSTNTSACEVEMSEAKQGAKLAPPTP